ncbi:MAG: winged helix-turn-helix transcriptional regulator [Rhizobiales bacterium]|nr:winged helix-turn-helix transcriptional regulator [Hyphomicrobiales bacterium]MBO6698704.1 winged helix-turn-helix transcriptional regulator [Hyphomicrobiales bacterium]MBO6735043.1 winged helix-turn-helix transcriptional regulator [Hyphomicrobiales bacterium]MBO6911151.1 winged helix-turn-helix transcriptional regulator [Hyphomicrobiales bacterium]MBO6955661.1 winged helix-turn-helix transcriptional regulator [Hyphomicrobiales bacterium]
MKPPPQYRVSCAADDEALARTAKALAHPARLALLRALSAERCCCGHLVRDLSQRDMTLAQSTVSQHLRVLVDAGLVTRTTCGVESYFNVNASALAAALDAFSTLKTSGAAETLPATQSFKKA